MHAKREILFPKRNIVMGRNNLCKTLLKKISSQNGKGRNIVMGCRWFTTHSPTICLTNRSHLGVGTKEGPNKVQTKMFGNGSRYLQVLTKCVQLHMDQMVFMV